jgi:hypothetical protein
MNNLTSLLIEVVVLGGLAYICETFVPAPFGRVAAVILGLVLVVMIIKAFVPGL